jgi:hypothetical protein
MTNDDELLARFTRRLAGIEADVKDPPPWSSGAVRGSVRFVGVSRPASLRGPIASMVGLFALVVIALAAVALLAGRNPAPTAPAVGGQAEVPTIEPSPAKARLIVVLVRERPPMPSGVTFGGIFDASIFLAHLTDAAGVEVASWQIGDPKVPDLLVSPDRYHLAIWQVEVTDNAETGARTTSEPFGGCSADFLLPPGTATTLTVRATRGQPCVIDPPTIH